MLPKKSTIVHAEELPNLAPDMFVVKTTSPLEKIIPSILNAIIAFGLATPFLIIFGPGLIWKIAVVICFGLYESYIFLQRKDRCFGMKIMDTYWEKKYSTKQHLIYNILYTLSFATLLIYFWFPLDLLLINILLIQLPIVLLTGTTLHGYLSGMKSVTIIAK